jgi:hypothetical protein
MADAFHLFNRPDWRLGTEQSSLDHGERVEAAVPVDAVGSRIMF